MSESGHFVKGGEDVYVLYQAKVLRSGVSGLSLASYNPMSVGENPA